MFTIPKRNSYGHIQYIQLNEENFLFMRALRLGEETKTEVRLKERHVRRIFQS